MKPTSLIAITAVILMGAGCGQYNFKNGTAKTSNLVGAQNATTEPGTVDPGAAGPLASPAPDQCGGMESEVEFQAQPTVTDEIEVEYKTCGTELELEFEIAGFTSGQQMSAFLVINGAEVKVADLAAPGAGLETQVEFEAPNFPAGIPLTITPGTQAIVKDAGGNVLFQGPMVLEN